MITPQRIDERSVWNDALATLPTAHILQSWEWGAFKQATTGWIPERYVYKEADTILAAASLLTRRVGPFAVMYVPKGPALDYANVALRDSVIDHLQRLANQRRAIWLKIDPDLPIATGIPQDEAADDDYPDVANVVGQTLITDLSQHGWRFSSSQVQFRNTLTLDLTQSEADLLADMNQSTRRKIRKAEKAGVIVREADLRGDDMQVLYDLYTTTGERQGFLIRPIDYYQTAWQTFTAAGLGQAFITEHEGVPLSGAVLFHFGRKAWYFYGMSGAAGRELQPNYLLQWTAIRWAKSQGFPIYDWWGAPDHFTEDDPMWGVYRFKRGFGGQVVRHIGAWDYVPNPALYWLYENAMPSIMNLWRRMR